jgi:hypothetical protein
VPHSVDNRTSIAFGIMHGTLHTPPFKMVASRYLSAVNRGASETGSASTQVLASARSLSAEGNKLKIEIDRFLSTVRA